MTELVSGVFLLIGFAFLIAIYFIPTIIAHKKKKKNTTAIAALNILGGWTFLGWIASFIWALTND